MINEPLVLYILFMTIASIISTYGSFVTLPYEHLPQWEAIKMALPYAWVDWIFLTIAIKIGKEHELVTPLQMKFSITIFKFFLILLFTKYYLGNDVSRSEVIGFIIVLLAYFINVLHLFSKYVYGIDVADKEKVKPGETGQTGENKPK